MVCRTLFLLQNLEMYSFSMDNRLVFFIRLESVRLNRLQALFPQQEALTLIIVSSFQPGKILIYAI